MDVYDFDKTLYQRDSTVDFFLFCLRRHPKVFLSVPRAVVSGLGHIVGLRTITQFKECFYRFLRHVPDVEAEVRLFWEASRLRVAGPCQPKPGDLVISASPEFLLAPICSELGLRLIASRVSPTTGLYEGINCRKEEKVRRFREEYPNATIDAFYSDSLSDRPLAILATQAFIVTKGTLVPWATYDPHFPPTP
ncbi:MAG: haloacid dehalogenase-like hydrolase [Coriobacteriales bacterium]|jgi:phosphoserine phosphatase|nr:haloacid dehalogenase-like hydrolase [Coriobacteriales bacterium]